MSKKKVLSVIGTRPQFIKGSIVSSYFDKSEVLEEIIINTGQHYDANLSIDFVDELFINKPKYHITPENGNSAEQLGSMICNISDLIIRENPDIVLVYGDTNSTLAGAVSANKLGCPLAHVESGLRSYNRNMPEEVNRVLTDELSELLFTPNQSARDILISEGKSENTIIHCGDVMYDLFQVMRSKFLVQPVHEELKLSLQYVVVTIHRAENTDNEYSLKCIINRLDDISRDIQVIWPMHPRVKKELIRLNLLERVEHSINIIEPVCYLYMGALLSKCSFVITDSGGLQKEAYFHQKKCIVLRAETEWMELIESKNSYLVDPLDKGAFSKSLFECFNTKFDSSVGSFYGSGDAATKIVNHLENYCM